MLTALGELLSIRLGHARVMEHPAVCCEELVGVLVGMQWCFELRVMFGVVLGGLNLSGRWLGHVVRIEEVAQA